MNHIPSIDTRHSTNIASIEIGVFSFFVLLIFDWLFDGPKATKIRKISQSWNMKIEMEQNNCLHCDGISMWQFKLNTCQIQRYAHFYLRCDMTHCFMNHELSSHFNCTEFPHISSTLTCDAEFILIQFLAFFALHFIVVGFVSSMRQRVLTKFNSQHFNIKVYGFIAMKCLRHTKKKFSAMNLLINIINHENSSTINLIHRHTQYPSK